MRSVKTLIKLQKSKVDDQRRVIAEHEKALARIEQEITELALQQAREQEIARTKPEEAITYGEFVKWTMQRNRDLHAAREAVVQALEKERDILAGLFEEQKRYEIILSNHEAAAAKEEQKREQGELDEIALTNYDRKERERS